MPRVRGFVCELVEGEPDTVSVRRVGHLSAPYEGPGRRPDTWGFVDREFFPQTGRSEETPERTEQTR